MMRQVVLSTWSTRKYGRSQPNIPSYNSITSCPLGNCLWTISTSGSTTTGGSCIVLLIACVVLTRRPAAFDNPAKVLSMALSNPANLPRASTLPNHQPAHATKGSAPVTRSAQSLAVFGGTRSIPRQIKAHIPANIDKITTPKIADF